MWIISILATTQIDQKNTGMDPSYFSFEYTSISDDIILLKTSFIPPYPVFTVWPMKSFNKIEGHLELGVTNSWSPSYPYNIGLASLHWIEVSTFNILTVGSSCYSQTPRSEYIQENQTFFLFIWRKFTGCTKTTAPTTKIIPKGGMFNVPKKLFTGDFKTGWVYT